MSGEGIRGGGEWWERVGEGRGEQGSAVRKRWGGVGS